MSNLYKPESHYVTGFSSYSTPRIFLKKEHPKKLKVMLKRKWRGAFQALPNIPRRGIQADVYTVSFKSGKLTAHEMCRAGLDADVVIFPSLCSSYYGSSDSLSSLAGNDCEKVGASALKPLRSVSPPFKHRSSPKSGKPVSKLSDLASDDSEEAIPTLPKKKAPMFASSICITRRASPRTRVFTPHPHFVSYSTDSDEVSSRASTSTSKNSISLQSRSSVFSALSGPPSAFSSITTVESNAEELKVKIIEETLSSAFNLSSAQNLVDNAAHAKAGSEELVLALHGAESSTSRRPNFQSPSEKMLAESASQAEARTDELASSL